MLNLYLHFLGRNYSGETIQEKVYRRNCPERRLQEGPKRVSQQHHAPPANVASHVLPKPENKDTSCHKQSCHGSFDAYHHNCTLQHCLFLMHHGSKKHIDCVFCCSATLHSKLLTFLFCNWFHSHSTSSCPYLLACFCLNVQLLCPQTPTKKKSTCKQSFGLLGPPSSRNQITNSPCIPFGFPTCWLASVCLPPIAALSANDRYLRMLPLTTTTIPDQVCSCPPAGDVNYMLATGSEVENNQPPSCLKKICSSLCRETERRPCAQPPAPFFQARYLAEIQSY
jgi:hypothetical protein